MTTGGGSAGPVSDIEQVCSRIGIVGIVFTALWTMMLIVFGVFGPKAGMSQAMMERWPVPGLAVAITGALSGIGLIFTAGWLRAKPSLLMDIGGGFLIITCFLFALLEFWVPRLDMPNPQWIGVPILAYASIVPRSPGNTLAVGFLAATMGPLAFLITLMRGQQVDASALLYFTTFFPPYACAVIATIPAKIIRRLGMQVNRARAVGAYQLDTLLGKGGMGEVYKATHQMLVRPAAVKLIRPEVMGATDSDTARVIQERFRREANAAASLRSPHTISLYDFGITSDGTFFIVTELLDGVDLETLVKKYGPVDPERAVFLLRQVCHSLAEAHSLGMVHRDIKPSNIFTCRLGLDVDYVKVLDFGLVKSDNDGQETDLKLTAPDRTTGTPAYIAPEVVLGNGRVTSAVDIYALGCVGYWLLTGRLVFEGNTAIQLMFHHANTAPTPPSKVGEIVVPPRLEAVIMQCLAKKPEDRPQDALELCRLLGESIDGPGWTVDKAERWWKRHKPENLESTGVPCEKIMLTKAGHDGEEDEGSAQTPSEILTGAAS